MINQQILDRINKEFESEFDSPFRTLPNGYKLFFRSYMGHYNNTLLVGAVLARRNRLDKFYVCICGMEPQEYLMGSLIPGWEECPINIGSTEENLRSAAIKAFDDMEQFLSSV